MIFKRQTLLLLFKKKITFIFLKLDQCIHTYALVLSLIAGLIFHTTEHQNRCFPRQSLEITYCISTLPKTRMCTIFTQL